jgi:hypothetical protein
VLRNLDKFKLWSTVLLLPLAMLAVVANVTR